MANALYGKGREAFLSGDIAWDTDDIRIILSDAADYVKSIDVDDFLNDVTAGARVATATSGLTAKTITLGTADATDWTFSAVTGDVSEEIITYKHTGVESTSNLIANIDTASGLPVTPNGGDIAVQWSSGADRIFTL